MNVLLDLDGTLTDSRQGIIGCIRHALIGLGDPCPPDPELRRYIGPPLHETFAALFGADAQKVDQAIALYRERYSATGLFDNSVYPGIHAALASLAARGAKLFLATSKPRVYAERIVEHFDLARHLIAVYGSELDGTRSNKAALIAHVLKTQGLSPHSSCMVGDRMHDMIGANANDVVAIGALWGYGSRGELIEAGARSLCEAPSSLAEAVSAAL